MLLFTSCNITINRTHQHYCLGQRKSTWPVKTWHSNPKGFSLWNWHELEQILTAKLVRQKPRVILRGTIFHLNCKTVTLIENVSNQGLRLGLLIMLICNRRLWEHCLMVTLQIQRSSDWLTDSNKSGRINWHVSTHIHWKMSQLQKKLTAKTVLLLT